MGKRVHLTQAVVDALRYGKDRQWTVDHDVPTLHVRLTKTSKSFVARWTSETMQKQRQETIAKCGEISVAEARRRARKLVAEDKPRSIETLNDVWEVWEANYSGSVSVDHADEMRRTWQKHIKPDLGDTKLSRLTHAKLQGWYNKKRLEKPKTASGKERKEPYSPNTLERWMSYISKLCKIARTNGWMTSNPCEGLEMAEPNKRLDVFVKDDIRDLGENLSAQEASYPIGVALIRFLMYFPCRAIEAREMEWGDLDLSEGIWTIPKARYKTREDKVFPLGPLQTEFLRSLPKWSERYVFPRPSHVGVGKTKQQDTDEILAVTKNHQNSVWKKVRPKPLGAHALRKTIGHVMLNGGVPLEYVSKLLGHSNTLVTQDAYAQLEPQKARAHLEFWTQILESDKDEEIGVEKDWMDDMMSFAAAKNVEAFNTALRAKIEEEVARQS